MSKELQRLIAGERHGEVRGLSIQILDKAGKVGR